MVTQTSISLAGRTVLITGASSGLGTHFSRLVAKAGAGVILAARRIDRLHALVEEIERDGGRAAAVAMDVTDEASIIAGFDAAEQLMGPVDTVIANAGISHAGVALSLTADDFDSIMTVNVRGSFLTAREGARRMAMRERKDNRIIFIASIGGLKALPGLTAYSTSKAAVVMMGQSLAREWINKGINVNVLCPGYVRTELNSQWFDSEGGAKQIAGFPRRRLMVSDQLNEMLLFLASTSASAVTGSVFKIDDGQTL
jgi:NAD(P)-dependent dehydrogenase (short-subunit alcohol dehydrogenase family)